MTSVLQIPAATGPVATEKGWRASRRPGPRAVLSGGVAAALLVLAVALAGLVADPRMITGAPAWLKPAKFGLSVTAYLLSLRWVVGQVQGHRRLLQAAAWTVVVALTGELVIIVTQAARGTTSHYNVSTPADAAAFGAMGAMISVVFLLTAALAVVLLRQRGLDAGLAAGVRWGLGVCLLGMAEAVLMITNSRWNGSGGHTVGAPDGGPGLPLTGWNTEHGDLRVAHFVGLHALQALPLLAFVLARRTGLDAPTRARLVRVAGTAQAALVGLLAWQAERGQALLRPDMQTLTALSVLILGAAAAAALILRTGRLSRVQV